jgi:hypothetical protein
VFLKGLKSRAPATVAISLLAVKGLDIEGKPALFSPFLRHADPFVRSRAVAVLWETADVQAKQEFKVILEKLLALDDRGAVMATLQAAGEIGDADLMPVLKAAISHPALGLSFGDSPEMTGVIRSLSRFRSEEAAMLLLRCAETADHYQQSLIESALAAGLVRHEKLLASALASRNDRVRQTAVAAVMRAKDQITPEVRRRLMELLDRELKRLYRLFQFSLLVEEHGKGCESRVLAAVIRENLVQRNLGHVVNIFSALHPTDILSTVPDKIISPSKHLRSNAIELLENNVKLRHVKVFLPLCEETPPDRLLAIGKSTWNFDTPGIYFLLGELFQENDPWVRAFTLFTALKIRERTRDAGVLRALNVTGQFAVEVLEGLVYG